MVDTSNDRRGIGNLHLSAFIDRFRQQTFLHRNLEQALSYHEGQLKGELDDRWEAMEAAVQDKISWDIPAGKKTLDRLVKKRQPDFRLVLWSIKPQNDASRVNNLLALKRAKFAPIACDIQTTICRTHLQHEKRKAGHSNEDTTLILLRDSQPAQLLARQTADSALPEFVVDMEPITFSTSKLELAIGKDDKWHSGLVEAYLIDICIRFKTSQDASNFLALAQPSQTIDRTAARAMRNLSASWNKLPMCPPAGHLLPLAETDQSSNESNAYGLAADMSFRNGSEPLLSMHNRALRMKDGHLTSALPRTNGARGHEGREILDEIINGANGRDLARQVKVGFAWARQAGFVVKKGFCCAICERRHFSSRENLLHHIQNSHRYLDFRVRTGPSSRSAKLKLDCIIELEVRKRLTEEKSTDATVKKGIKWLAPSRAFDIHRHLEEEDGWFEKLTEERDKSGVTHALQERPAIHERSVRKSLRKSAGHRATHRAPEDVPDLPIRPRSTRPVPRVAGGKTLFRLDSKRPLREGEELSESDEDIDTHWTKPRRELMVAASSDLSRAQKKFATLWNDYFEEKERLSGDLYMDDATVRFLRARAKDIANGHLEVELDARLALLVETGIIRQEVLRYGRELIEQAKEPARDSTPVMRAPQSRGATGQETHRVFECATADGRGTSERPSTAQAHRVDSPNDVEGPAGGTRSSTRRAVEAIQSPARNSSDTMDIDSPSAAPNSATREQGQPDPVVSTSKGKQPSTITGMTCLCGESAESMRTAIHCSNLDCGQPHYHLSCVGMARRDPRWLCPRCSA